MSLGYSNLEVVPDESAPIPHHEEKIAVYSHYITPYDHNNTSSRNHAHYTNQSQKDPTRVCGLTRKVFWLVLSGLIIILIGGAVGGAVGGIQASKHGSSTDSPAQQTTLPGHTAESASKAAPQSSTASTDHGPTTDPPPATKTDATAVAVTTTTLISPTRTLLRDCPSSNNTIRNALGLESYQFRKVCEMGYRQFPINLVNHVAKSLNDCIDLCVAYNVSNRTEIATGKSDICNGVCWWHDLKATDFPGQCFGFPVKNSSETGFQYTNNKNCDSAAWVNQIIP